MSLLKCCRAKCDNEPRESVYYEDVHGQQYAEVDACAQHIDSLRKYIPGFTAENPTLCVVKECENKRRAIGCCENHSKHVKKWGLQELAKEYAAHSGVAIMGTAIGISDIEPFPEPVVIDDIAEQQFNDAIESRLNKIADQNVVPVVITSKIHEEDTMNPLCADATEASPVDVECDAGNPLIEAWQKAKLVPVEVMDERLAEILRLEQENTALREQLAKVEQQTSTFVLDEADLCQRYRNIAEARNMIEKLDSGADVGVTVNYVNVWYPKSEVERIKNTLRRSAEKAIEDATTLNVTVPPKDALFYLVWSPDGRTPPRYKHYSLDEAKKAANQMKSIHGGEFYAVAVIGDVSDNKEDIPF